MGFWLVYLLPLTLHNGYFFLSGFGLLWDLAFNFKLLLICWHIPFETFMKIIYDTHIHIYSLHFNLFFPFISEYFISMFLSTRIGVHRIFSPKSTCLWSRLKSSWIDVAMSNLCLGCRESVSICGTYSLITDIPAYPAAHWHPKWELDSHSLNPGWLGYSILIGQVIHFAYPLCWVGCPFCCVCQTFLGLKKMEERYASHVSFFLHNIKVPQPRT